MQQKESSAFAKVDVSGAKPFVVVGVPAFNEERSIARVVLEAQKYSARGEWQVTTLLFRDV